jgi:hypothetical protein
MSSVKNSLAKDLAERIFFTLPGEWERVEKLYQSLPPGQAQELLDILSRCARSGDYPRLVEKCVRKYIERLLGIPLSVGYLDNGQFLYLSNKSVVFWSVDQAKAYKTLVEQGWLKPVHEKIGVYLLQPEKHFGYTWWLTVKKHLILPAHRLHTDTLGKLPHLQQEVAKRITKPTPIDAPEVKRFLAELV